MQKLSDRKIINVIIIMQELYIEFYFNFSSGSVNSEHELYLQKLFTLSGYVQCQLRKNE